MSTTVLSHTLLIFCNKRAFRSTYSFEPDLAVAESLSVEDKLKHSWAVSAGLCTDHVVDGSSLFVLNFKQSHVK